MEKISLRGRGWKSAKKCLVLFEWLLSSKKSNEMNFMVKIYKTF